MCKLVSSVRRLGLGSRGVTVRVNGVVVCSGLIKRIGFVRFAFVRFFRS